MSEKKEEKQKEQNASLSDADLAQVVGGVDQDTTINKVKGTEKSADLEDKYTRQ